MKLARYFRAMALTASTADLMTMSLRLAAHYERLAKAGLPDNERVELAGKAVAELPTDGSASGIIQRDDKRLPR